jgi:hypothetical protein
MAVAQMRKPRQSSMRMIVAVNKEGLVLSPCEKISRSRGSFEQTCERDNSQTLDSLGFRSDRYVS